MTMVWETLTPPYRTIVADPPWAYATKAGITTAGRHRRTKPASDAQYSTMTMDALGTLPVGDLAANDAHLYLWTTNPMLPHAFGLLAAWGFRYITTITWRKVGNMGMGFYFRGDTEHVLFGVRGKLPIAPADRQRNWFEAPKTGHSRKPDAFYDMVERVSPGPRVELFARDPMLGWDSWGKGYESAAVSPLTDTPEEHT